MSVHQRVVVIAASAASAFAPVHALAGDCFEHIGDAPVESLRHAIGSGRPGLGQPVFDAQFLAQLIELVVATGLTLLAGKQAVRELLAIVRSAVC